MKIMKKSFFLSLAIVAIMIACKKQDEPESLATATTSEAVDVTIDQGSSFVYKLEDESSASADIASAAAHASVSRIASLPSSTVIAYQYTPDSTFTGRDSVVINV